MNSLRNFLSRKGAGGETANKSQSEIRHQDRLIKYTRLVAPLLMLQPLLASVSFSQGCAPTVAGLVSWWAGENDAADIAGANQGTLYGGVSFAAGEVGQAFVLGGGSHVRIPDSASLHFTNGLTIEAWVFPTAHGTYHEIVSKWNAAGSGAKSYDLSLAPDGTAYLDVCADGNDGFATTVQSITSLPLNQWTHVAATFDGAAVSIFINGSLERQLAYAHQIFPGLGDLGIGGTVGGVPNGQAAFTFAGMLDEVSLYSRGLSQGEIQAIVAAGTGGKCKGPTEPQITSQPSSLTVHRGLDARFSVGAGGSSPLRYQWRFEGTNVAGATQNTLILNYIQPIQAGAYSVRITNSSGSVTSSDAILSVDPQCVSAAPGLIAWWAGEGDATEPISGDNGTLAGGLGFAPGERGQGFSFNGTDSYVAIPASLATDAGAGEGFTLECWIKPARLDSPQVIAEWNSGVGDIAVHLHHSNPGIGGPGAIFADVVDFGGGSHIFASIANVLKTNAFQHVALTYNRTNGAAKIYRNGAPVVSQTIGSFRPQTTFPLDFGARVSGAFSGEYFAGIMDEIALYNRALTDGEIQNIFAAGTNGKVCIAPQVVTQPANQRVRPGTNVTFNVLAAGTPTLGYQWRFNGVGMNGATNTSLTLSNVQPSAGGNYSVVLSNYLGTTTSSDALLKVDVVLAFGNGQPLTNASTSFPGAVSVQLTNVYTNGLIFYTLDGSTPSFSSAQYSGAFIVTQAVVLRALGYRADFFQSGQLDPVNILIPPSYSLTTSSPGGGSISLTPPGGSYLSNAPVTVVATPSAGWSFLQWLGDASGTNATNVITMTRGKFVQAVFGTTLSTTAAGGGSVSLSPPDGIYPYGTIVWLSAIPQSGNYFGLWGNAASGNVNPLAFGVSNANPSVSSLFTTVPGGQAALTVVPVGKGRVAVSPRTNVCNIGQLETVTATPDAGQRFLGWSGDASGTQNPLTLSMNSSKMIFANFSQTPSLSARSSFEGLKPEGFVLTVNGDFGARYALDGSSNLTAWTNLGSVTNSWGTIQFLDSSAGAFKMRFYRARLLP
jgi:hypothetical protein